MELQPQTTTTTTTRLMVIIHSVTTRSYLQLCPLAAAQSLRLQQTTVSNWMFFLFVPVFLPGTAYCIQLLPAFHCRSPRRFAAALRNYVRYGYRGELHGVPVITERNYAAPHRGKMPPYSVFYKR